MAQLDLIVGLCSGSRERFATIIGYLLLVPKAGFPMRLETAEQTHAVVWLLRRKQLGARRCSDASEARKSGGKWKVAPERPAGGRPAGKAGILLADCTVRVNASLNPFFFL